MSYFGNWFKSKSITNVAKKTIAKVDQLATKFEAKIAHLATDLAYKLAKGETVYKEHESKTVESLKNDGWKVLCNSSEFADTNQYGYKAVAFVKEGSKEVLIATAGTVPTDLHDLKDDAFIASGSFPSKVAQVKAMVDHVSTLLSNNASNYTFNVTGHSLGAVLTDATAFEIMSKGFKLGTSITFDSPGSKNAIIEAEKAGVFSKDTPVTIEDLAEHCIIYNAKHNLINNNPIISCPHITEPKLVLFAKKEATDEAIQYITPPSGVLGYAHYLVSKVGSNIIKTCSGYLGITRVLDEVESLKGHSLANFADLDGKAIIQTEGWDKTADGKLFIKDFNKLSNITSTGNDVISSKPDDDFDVVSTHSYDDLRRANDNDYTPLSGDVDFPSLEFIN